MTDKKTEISDRERERRAKQQAQQQQQKHGGPPGQANTKQGGYSPANVVQRVTKSTGRGT